MVVDDDRFAGGMFGGAAVNDDAYTGQGGYEAVAGLWSGSAHYWLSVNFINKFYPYIFNIYILTHLIILVILEKCKFLNLINEINNFIKLNKFKKLKLVKFIFRQFK